MVGKKLSDYLPVGVQGDAKELKVPEGTEVVTDYRFIHAGTNSSMTSRHGMGTALIPRDYKPSKENTK